MVNLEHIGVNISAQSKKDAAFKIVKTPRQAKNCQDCWAQPSICSGEVQQAARPLPQGGQGAGGPPGEEEEGGEGGKEVVLPHL